MFYFSWKRSLPSWASLVAVTALSLFYTSCSEDSDEPALSNECELLSFKIEGVEVDMTNGTPVIVVPAGTDVSNLTPIIEISEGATISPASGVAQDFSKSGSVSYTVTAAGKNNTKTYSINVRYTTGVQAFSLGIAGRQYEGVIDPVKKEIRVIIDFKHTRRFDQLDGYDLVTNVTLQNGFRIEPAAGAVIDLDNPLEQIVYDDATGTATTYKLVLVNSDASFEVISLEIPGVESSFNWGVRASVALSEYNVGLDEHDIVFVALTTDDISALTVGTESWAMPERATVVPGMDAPQNFNQDVAYTVTAESGTSISNFTTRVVREKFISFNCADDRTSETYWLHENYVPISYRAISPVTGAKLISESDNAEYTCTISFYPADAESPKGPMRMHLSNNAIPVGNYKLHVTLQNGDSFLTKTRVVRKK